MGIRYFQKRGAVTNVEKYRKSLKMIALWVNIVLWVTFLSKYLRGE